VIHEDIIKVWNFDDGEGYLLSREFMAGMSYVVGDLAGRDVVSPESYFSVTATPMAQWMDGPYPNNNPIIRSSIRCIMAYIVDLSVILHDLFSVRL